jgi:hypothetical protein
LQQLEKDPTALFRKRDLLNKSKQEFEQLKTQGLFTFVQADPEGETYPCNLPCSKTCPREIVEMQGEYFAICPDNAEIDPLLLSEDDLHRYAFSIQKLLEEIRKANRLNGRLHVIEPDYSYLGYATHQDRRIGFLFGFKITGKSVLDLSGLKRLCADDDFLVVFSPVSVIEDVSHKRELDRERVVQTSFVSSLNFQTYELSVEKLLSGLIARRENEIKSSVEVLLAKASKWEEISIDVLDNDTVRYKVGTGGWKRINYAELGFKHKLKGLPNKLWGIFEKLAENCKNQVI